MSMQERKNSSIIKYKVYKIHNDIDSEEKWANDELGPSAQYTTWLEISSKRLMIPSTLW